MPLYQAQFSKATLYTTAGANSFVVPLNVSMVWITTIGGAALVLVVTRRAAAAVAVVQGRQFSASLCLSRQALR